jgi:cell division protein FtsX
MITGILIGLLIGVILFALFYYGIFGSLWFYYESIVEKYKKNRKA